MKKISILLFTLLLTTSVIFIKPSISEASWWNPASWFNNWTFSTSIKQNAGVDIKIPEPIPKKNANADNQKISEAAPAQEKIKVVSTTTPNTIVDTKTNLLVQKCTNSDCFVTLIKSCAQAYYQSDSQVETLGSLIKSKLNLSLQQIDNQCLLSITPVSYSITPSQDLINSTNGAQPINGNFTDIYSKLNTEAQLKIVNKKGVCNITKNKDEIITLVNKKSEVYLFADPDYSMCTGDLFTKSTPDTSKNTETQPKTVEECKGLNSYSAINECVKQTVKTINECNTFSSDLDRGMCIKQLALKQKDPSICSAISKPADYSTTQVECYGEIAALKKDYGICGQDNFDKIKSSKNNSSLMAVECVKKYCSASGPDKWWGCGN